MSDIVHYLPVSKLDDLVRATGFDLGRTSYEYKYRWLLHRIASMRLDSQAAAIVHDNPDQAKLISLIQYERKWSEQLQGTIAALQAELSVLRDE